MTEDGVVLINNENSRGLFLLDHRRFREVKIKKEENHPQNREKVFFKKENSVTMK